MDVSEETFDRSMPAIELGTLHVPRRRRKRPETLAQAATAPLVSPDAMPRTVVIGSTTRTVAAMHDRRAICSAERPDPDLLAALCDAIDRPGLSTLFIDVFDTLLLRDELSEIRRFHMIAECWSREIAELKKVSPLDLLLARLAATRAVYRTRPGVDGCREGHIDDILAMTVHIAGGGRNTATRMKQIELQFETSHLAANRLLLAVAEKIRASGADIVLVSDMYLDGPAIAGLVSDVTGRRELFADIVSSADTVVSKQSGRLFPHLLATRGLDAARCVHIGDSLVSDIRPARDAGMGFVHFPISDVEHRTRQQDEAAFLRMWKTQGVELDAWRRVNA